MYLKQFFVEGLGHSSYIIASDRTGEAAVVDPRRDLEEYEQELQRQGHSLRLVLETHAHNDYVSGARQLADLFGATHVAPAEVGFAYPYKPVRQNDTFELGELAFKVFDTPGHTPQHAAYVVADTTRADDPVAVFTGGNLLVGSVGRVDLLGEALTETLARSLYRSLVDRLLQLPDFVEVLPTHGAGSFCAKGIGRRRTSTVGYERRFNHLFGLAEDDFVREVMAGNPGIPAYYPRARRTNLDGPSPWQLHSAKALAPADVAQMVEQGAVILDVRSPLAFGAGHIPGSINVEFGSNFSTWSGWLVPADRPIVLVLEDAGVWEEVVTALARVAQDNVTGFVRNDVRGWIQQGRPIEQVPQLSVQRLAEELKSDSLLLLDVREDNEWQQGHNPEAKHVRLGDLSERATDLDFGRPVAVICSTGFRSSIAASLLKRQGFARVHNVIGGMTAWQAAGLPVVKV